MRRRLFIFLVFLGLAACAVVIIAGNMKKNASNAPSSAVTTPERNKAAPTTTPVPPASEPGPEQDNGNGNASKGKSSRKGSVTAASQAIEALSVAQFLPPHLLRQSVQDLAVPDIRQKLIAAYAQTGPLVAKSLGYDTIDEVLQNAEYRVQTDKYRVDRFANGKATVSLYTVSHWVTRNVGSDNTVQWKEFTSPGIRVVEMRWINGRWLYASARKPAPGQAPQFTESDVNLTYNEIERRYMPYLEKGYKTYVPSK